MRNDLLKRYRELLNTTLPFIFQKPVRYNHCFNRIVLDWLFQDVWYRHLDKNRPAVNQVDEEQLSQMIARMEQWLSDRQLLFEDNNNSLKWRKKV